MIKIDLSEPDAINILAGMTSDLEKVATKIRLRLYHKYPQLAQDGPGEAMALRSTRLAFLKEHGVEAHVEGKLIRVVGKEGEIARLKLAEEIKEPEHKDTHL